MLAGASSHYNKAARAATVCLYACGVLLLLVAAVALCVIANAATNTVAALQAAAGAARAPPAPVAPAADGGAACTWPPHYAASAYARYLIAVGDQFAAGAGVDSALNWLALLRGRAHIEVGADVQLLNAAATGQALAAQVAAVRASAQYAALLAAGDTALVVLSYGVDEMAAVGGTANVGAVADVLAAALRGSAANASDGLVAPGHEAQFQVLLLLRPDPAAGGVRVPPALMQCAGLQRALNYPTLDDYAARLALYGAQRTLCHGEAALHGYGALDVDAALGAYSWARAGSRAACAFADCSVYGELGQSLLAEAVWRCVTRQNGTAPAGAGR